MKEKCAFTNWDDPGWAVITGASSGIGAEFARQLAAHRFSIFLTSRRGKNLEFLARSLQETYGSQTEVLAADLSDMEDIARLATRLLSLKNLDILVSNAGSTTVGPFFKSDLEKQVGMIHVQNIAPVFLTRTVLPRMIERNRGLIIFTASQSVFFSSPGSGVYTPAKSFLKAFAETLSLELQHTAIQVQALYPGYTHTGFHDDAAFDSLKAYLPKWVWGTSHKVVEDSLRGARNGKTVVIPGLINRLTIRCAPKGLMLNSYMKHRWKALLQRSDTCEKP